MVQPDGFRRGKFIPGTGIKGTNFSMAAYTLNDVPIKFRSEGGGLMPDSILTTFGYIQDRVMPPYHNRDRIQRFMGRTHWRAYVMLVATGKSQKYGSDYFAIDGSGYLPSWILNISPSMYVSVTKSYAQTTIRRHTMRQLLRFEDDKPVQTAYVIWINGG
ncbi:hypothetical protein ARMSODRAFT_979158 [Armillaria solidipes]|uniref:Uncharacterized protein n=1 Tax=Armillaria solidipes TaxID=1076256 RepID=A0A2H3B638_9AGAR|nr:hypothetical protein ARMSODRAFT_979158 [Armillaria solidipes]